VVDNVEGCYDDLELETKSIMKNAARTGVEAGAHEPTSRNAVAVHGSVGHVRAKWFLAKIKLGRDSAPVSGKTQNADAAFFSGG
jgi:hypothetical protein